MTNLQKKAFFSSELKRALDRHGITAATLAQQLLLNPQHVCRWAAGIAMPTLEAIELIAEHLHDDALSKAGTYVYSRECRNCGEIYTKNSFIGRDSYLCSRRCRKQNQFFSKIKT